MTNSFFKIVSARVTPSSFLDVREFLDAFYSAVKANAGRYSYVTFAADLGFAPTNLIHQLIVGRRPLTTKTARKIVAGLGLTGVERRYFLELVALRAARSGVDREKSYERLLAMKQASEPSTIHRDMMEYYGAWYHGIIREMTRLDQFQSTPSWIADRLHPRVRPEQIQSSLELLERLKLIKYDEEKGRHVPLEETVSTGHEAYGMALMTYHSNMLDLARKVLVETDPAQRDFSTVTVSLSSQGVERLKALIHQFQMQLLKEDDQASSRDEVFQVNIQMFPFTKS